MRIKQTTHLVPLVLACVLEVGSPWLLAADAGPIRVGWAEVDLTPELSKDRQAVISGLLIPRFSSEVKSRVTATALALESVDETGRMAQAVMVSCDHPMMSFFFDDRQSPLGMIRERLRSRLPDLDPRMLFLMATHAHSTPMFDENEYALPKEGILRPSEYLEFMVQRLCTVVETAWNQRKAGGVTWGLGHAVVGVNRRVVYPDGRAVMGGWKKDPAFDHVEGTEDHGVEILFFWDDQSRLTGVLVNLACPSQTESQALYISADFWDSVRTRLRQNPDFAKAAILPQLAAAGDQWPTSTYVREKAEDIMRQRRGLSKSEELGRRIAQAVLDVYPLVRADIARRPVLRHNVSNLQVPYRSITAADAAEAKKEYDRFEANRGDPFRQMQLHKFGALLKAYERQRSGPVLIDTELHAIRLGDVAIVTNPFELFLDYGLQIKARSPAVLTLTSELSAEVGRFAGYLASERAIAAGGYSAETLWFNYVGAEGGNLVVNRSVEMLKQLWPEAK